MKDKEACPGRIPKKKKGNRGVCAECGREGFINAKGVLYPHKREVANPVDPDDPILVEYEPIYREVTLKLTACVDCGSLIANQAVHDQWHEAVVHDFRRLDQMVE